MNAALLRRFAPLCLLLAIATPAHAATPVTGIARREVFTSIPGTLITDLTSSAKFLAEAPDSVEWLTSLQTPVDVADEYGQRLTTLLIPPETGDYIFFIASDDTSELWLSTDATPLNKQLIARVEQWTANLEWSKFPETQNNALSPVRLEFGRQYFLEALMKEGAGGDNLAVGWALPGRYVDPYTVPEGLTNVAVIPGSALSSFLNLTNSTLMVAPAGRATINPIPDGATTPSTVLGTDFGGMGVKTGSRDQGFTIYSVRSVDLSLTGQPPVTISGPHAADFNVVTQPPAVLAPGANATFVVRFDPSLAGLRQAVVSLPHNAEAESPFDFAIQGFGLGGGAGVLGNDSEGVTWTPIADNQIHGNRFQSPRDMQIKELRAKVLEISGTYKCAVYSDTNGAPNRLLQSSLEVVGATNGWNTFALTSPQDLAAGEYYWLVIWSDSADARAQFDLEGQAFVGSYAYVDLAGQWPEPMVLNAQGVRTYCLYAEGTPLGLVAGPACDLRGNGKLIVAGDVTPSALDGTDYGSVSVGTGSKDQVFMIDNPGDAALELGGNPRVEIVGPHAADFQVTAQPSTPVAPGGKTQFTVRFRPAVRGLRMATVKIVNNNPGSNPYDFAIQGAGYLSGRESIWPETKTAKEWKENTNYELGMIFRAGVPGRVTHIRVYAVAGERGDHTARLWRNTDETVISGPHTWTFGGSAGWITLDIPDVDIEADTDYTVAVSTGSIVRNYANIAADVARGGNNGLNLSYPDNAGVFSTVMGERPTSSYNGGNYLRDIIFVPAGVTVDLPDMVLRGNDVVIPDGGSTPGVADGSDFGSTAAATGSVDHLFTIVNAGSAPLNLSANPRIALKGDNASDFRVLTQPPSPVAIGGSVNFTIRFAPSAPGLRKAIVSIDNDSDKTPYDFAVAGTGTSSSLRVSGVTANPLTGNLTLSWSGGEGPFQVEKAPAAGGPYTAAGSMQTERTFTDPGVLKSSAQSFYRVRQQ